MSEYLECVAQFDGATWRMYTRADGLNGELVKAIASDNAGNVWFATWREEWSQFGVGVSRFDGQSWTSFDSADGLIGDSTNDIAVDGSGAVWIGTGAGLSRYKNGSWTSYTTANGLSANMVQVVAAHGDDVYLGTPGLSHFDGQIWTTMAPAPGLPVTGFDAIAFDADGYPVVTYAGGLSRYTGSGWVAIGNPAGGASASASSVAVDAGGDIWIEGPVGSTQGVYRRVNNGWQGYGQAQGLAAEEVYHLTGGGTTMWFVEDDVALGRLRVLYGLNERLFLPLLAQRQ
jgi:ligand-binding sensor domain-containing protein